MTTAPERRTATLTELVAQEIDSVRGRRRMSQAQLAKAIGRTPMWVSLRLRGIQPIDLNDLLLFARALDVEVNDLMPPPAAVAAAVPGDTERYLPVAVQVQREIVRPPDNRPSGRPLAAASPGVTRTAYVDRPRRRRRDR